MNTYSVKKGQMGDTILEINGVQSVCPFTQPLMAQGNMGQVQILRMPCPSDCPLTSVSETSWTIDCGQGLNVFPIREKIEEPQEPSKLIIV